ncbi:thiamine diphosphokinase [Desulfotomaculum sp. 1211_IL3151]|uniref:thiamine diphosphokinase n=1 Tax=Desulfotomaculum sp. 1211_IL3151 TaxID=3084055 RepID=UPI002FD991C8
MTKGRILIFSGGNLGAWALAQVATGDFILGVDRGAYYLIQNGIVPDLAMGDFDSVTPRELASIKQQSKNFMSCDPVMKNETDTEIAFNWALQQKPREIILFGALGDRFDHSLANVHLLAKGLQQGVPCQIVGEKNQIMLMNDQITVQQDGFPQVSLLPLTMQVTGINLSGFQYPLANATLNLGHSLGISNVLQEARGKIEVEEGLLLIIKSKD